MRFGATVADDFQSISGRQPDRKQFYNWRPTWGVSESSGSSRSSRGFGTSYSTSRRHPTSTSRRGIWLFYSSRTIASGDSTRPLTSSRPALTRSSTVHGGTTVNFNPEDHRHRTLRTEATLSDTERINWQF